MAFKYLLSPDAAEDFERIYDYIANNLSNPVSADKLSEKFKTAMRNACEFPKIYPMHNGYHKIIVSNYLIFYKVDDSSKTIIVHCAVYGAMDYDKFL